MFFVFLWLGKYEILGILVGVRSFFRVSIRTKKV